MPEPVADLAALIEELAGAATIYDKVAAASVCDRLIAVMKASPDPVDEKLAKQALGQLRAMRAFGDMQRLGDALIRYGQDSPQVVRQYAQALIEAGSLIAAEGVLVNLAEREPLGSKEGNEARGLLGRTYKQIYLDAGNPHACGAEDALRKSIDAYLEVYEHDPSQTWHGQNAAELLLRAERDGIAIDGRDPREIARTILDLITEAELGGTADRWAYGTARQVAMVLDDVDAASEWLKKGMEKDPDAFSLAAATRQLEELWGVTEDDPKWGNLLKVLKSHMMLAGGGNSVVVDAEQATMESIRPTGNGLEKVFGAVGAVTVEWWQMALDRVKSIARIDNSIGEGQGTAFVVKASDLNPAWGDGHVLITNNHVVSSPIVSLEGGLESILPEEAFANFTRLEKGSRIPVLEVLYQSHPKELDVTVLRVESVPDDAPPIPLAKGVPVADGSNRLYVMGHPRAGDLKISIDDNVLIRHDEPKVYYKAPTEGGSSGSPVFNRKWELIALHHGWHTIPGEGGIQDVANEGIVFRTIATTATGGGDSAGAGTAAAPEPPAVG